MSRDAFIGELRHRMAGLPQEAVERTVEYYSELIADSMEDGVSEEEAVERLGSLDEIVANVVKETPLAPSPRGIGEECLVEELAWRDAVHLDAMAVEHLERPGDIRCLGDGHGCIERQPHVEVFSRVNLGLEFRYRFGGRTGRDGNRSFRHLAATVP